jgi:hypothetical protein
MVSRWGSPAPSSAIPDCLFDMLRGRYGPFVRGLHTRNRQRDSLTRRRGWESRKRRVSIIVLHAKSTPDRAMGSEGNAGARKEKDQVVNRERVPDVKDTCIMI